MYEEPYQYEISSLILPYLHMLKEPGAQQETSKKIDKGNAATHSFSAKNSSNKFI